MSKISVRDVLDAIERSGIRLDAARLDVEKRLTEQGADSLDMTTLIFELEESFGVTISDESLAEGSWASVGRIVDSLNRLKQS